jgi:hypothetical protein
MEAMRGVAPVRDLQLGNGYVGDTEELVPVRLAGPRRMMAVASDDPDRSTLSHLDGEHVQRTIT